MTGLEKIKDRILDEARAEAEKRMRTAEEEAKTLIADAEADAERTKKEISEKSAKDVAVYREKISSSIELQRRNSILKAKQELISGILEAAETEIDELPADEYFELMLKLAEKKSQAKAGEIGFSERDLERLPSDYEAKLNAAVGRRGGSLRISEKPIKIKNGFILVYGDIEENCALEALFTERKDELSDIARKLLFP